MKDGESKERWGQYFNMLMNKENQRGETEDRDPNQAMTRNISVSDEETERESERESERERERERERESKREAQQ